MNTSSEPRFALWQKLLMLVVILILITMVMGMVLSGLFTTSTTITSGSGSKETRAPVAEAARRTPPSPVPLI